MEFILRPMAVFTLFFLTLNHQLSTARAQGTAFTYQGRLNDGASPANGGYDLTFTLYTTNTGGPATAGPVTNAATAVNNGLFTVMIDFGADVFTGSNYWLEIGVRTNGGTSFTTLAPRQPVTPMPYAVFANTAMNLLGEIPVSQLSGTIPLALLPEEVVTNNASGVTLDGNFAGNVVTNGGVATNIQFYGTSDSRAVKIQGGHHPSEYQINSTNNGTGGNIQDVLLRYSDWRDIVWYRVGVDTNRYHPQSPFVETEIAVTNAANQTANAKAYWQVSVWDRRATGGHHFPVAQWYEYDWNGGTPSGYNFDGKTNVVSINLDDGFNWSGNIVYTMYTYDYLMLYKGILVNRHRWDDGNGNILATNLVGPIRTTNLVGPLQASNVVGTFSSITASGAVSAGGTISGASFSGGSLSVGTATISGGISASSFTGSGSGLTGIPLNALPSSLVTNGADVTLNSLVITNTLSASNAALGLLSVSNLVSIGSTPIIRRNPTYIANASIVGRGDVMMVSWSNNRTTPVSGVTVITITNLWNGGMPPTTNTLFVNGVYSSNTNSPPGTAFAPDRHWIIADPAPRRAEIMDTFAPDKYWIIADPASPSNSVIIVSASPSASTFYSVCFRVDKIQ